MLPFVFVLKLSQTFLNDLFVSKHDLHVTYSKIPPRTNRHFEVMLHNVAKIPLNDVETCLNIAQTQPHEPACDRL